MYSECKFEGEVFNKFEGINDLFLAAYHIAPYGGCEFGCAYCDAWAFSDKPINENICSYSNLLEKLEAQLPNTDPKEFIGFTLGDPYQPAEKHFRLTRKALERIGADNRSVIVLTKSPLILENLDLFKQLNTHAAAMVVTTIITLDAKLLRHLESKVPSPKERIAMISSFKGAGIPSGFALIPIIPFLTDEKQGLLNLLELAAEVKPDFFVWEYLWIPNRRYRIQIETLLHDIDKSLIPKFKALYQDNAQPDITYRNSIDRFLIKTCQKIGLESRIPPRFYQNYLPYEKVSELIQRREKFLAAGSEKTKALNSFIDNTKD